jgi:hypothetical protein
MTTRWYNEHCRFVDEADSRQALVEGINWIWCIIVVNAHDQKWK